MGKDAEEYPVILEDQNPVVEAETPPVTPEAATE